MILCCGEALIDFVPLPDSRGYKPCPGGSVYNVAVGLGRLETPVSFFCQMSTDFFGDLLLDTLRENGVDTTLCPRTADPTTLAFVSLPGEGQEPRFLFYANQTADRLLAIEALPALPETVRALHFGSISLVLEPGASTLETLLRRESGRRILTLDPNVRPALIADKAAYRRRFEGWVELVDVVKLSRVDLEFIYPGQTAEAVITGWLARGPGLCLLTNGALGAAAFTAAGANASAPVPPVAVVDTVGAGDTFLAAALAYLAQEGVLYDREKIEALSTDQLEACLAYAGRAAAINCTRQGADPPTKREMEMING